MAENKSKSADELQKHMTATYFTLRMGIIIVAATLPLILWFVGKALGVPLKDSMSAYYYSDVTLLRDVFVGILCAAGAFLYLYKGFSTRENYALNCAGILIICVAFIPTTAPGQPAQAFSAHGASAVLFFVAIAYVCLFRASDTLSLMKDGALRRRYSLSYRMLGIGMITAPATAYVLTMLARGRGDANPYVFFVEFVGVWIFAAYWLLKSREIAQTDAERLVAEGAVQADSSGKLVPGAAYTQPAHGAGLTAGARRALA